MSSPRAPFWTLLGLVAAGCGGGSPPPPSASVPQPPVSAEARDAGAPRETKAAPVVVAMVIDQFAAWVAEDRLRELPPDGGFARLVREGTWVRTMRYPYAITDTAPGHASLHTGRVPAESGITTNESPDDTGKKTSIYIDASTRLVVPGGSPARPASSAKRLRVPTVADRLREARPDATILSVSLKDRAALVPAGQKPTHALWFDPEAGSFVTSSTISETFPSWAAPIGDKAAVARAMSKPWVPSDPAWLARVAGKDDAPGEGDLVGLGTVFPHTIKTPKAFRATPMADAMILDLALAGVAAEHKPGVPLLLLVSLTPNDVIGHVFGPDSWEAWDELRRLDGQLARFFVELEKAVGPYSLILSGDHGTVSMPEARLPLPAACKDPSRPPDPYERPRCIRGGRLEPEGLTEELRVESTRVVGKPYFTGIADGTVFLSSEANKLGADKRAALDEVVRAVFLKRHKEAVLSIHDVRDLRKRCPEILAKARGVPDRARPGEDVEALVCRSWADVPDSGDYIVVPRLGFFFDGEHTKLKGTSHGTPHLYDRTVPLFVRTSDRGPDDGRVVTDPVDFTAYAALEAALLGLTPDATVRGILDAKTAR